MKAELLPISRQTRVGASAFFNAAGVGLPSEESVQASLRPSDGWDAVLGEVRDHFRQLLGVPEEYVTIFHNTTAGIQRVFLRIGHLLTSRNAMLLTTDLEYPGTVAMADECWQGPMVIAEIAHLIWEGRCDEVLDVLKRSFLLTRPAVIYISHVARGFGYPLDLEFIRFVKSVNPSTIIVIDGAQAIGNIAIGEELLSLVDFYVTSGHKWLGGKPTLGVVYAHPKWHIPDQAQAYSRLSGSGGTGNLETLRSTAVALRDFRADEYTLDDCTSRSRQIADHNAALSSLFCELLESEGIKLFPLMTKRNNRGHWPVNGIVVVQGHLAPYASAIDTSGDLRKLEQLETAGRVMAAYVKSEPWVMPGGGSRAPRALAQYQGDSIVLRPIDLREDGLCVPMPNSGLLRFCFHYFHSSADVRALVRLLGAVDERAIRPGRAVA